MTPPSLRDLAARCTPGPYGYEFSSANDAYEIAPIIPGDDHGLLDWDNEIAMTASANEAQAQLIARLSPEVVIAVYQALELAKEELMAPLAEAAEKRAWGKRYEFPHDLLLQADAKVRAALALLDGIGGADVPAISNPSATLPVISPRIT